MGQMELTVLGCSGSYGTPAGGACSSYLVRAGDTTLWVDCGNGAFARLQQHAHPSEIDAVVISHVHPDHCADIYGLHVCNRWNLGRSGLPVIAPEGVAGALEALVGDFGDTFSWIEVADGDALEMGEAHLAFSRTHHPVPT